MIRTLLLSAPLGIVVLLALLLLGCASKQDSLKEHLRRERILTYIEVRDCITGGEPANTDDWLALVLECTE